MDALTASRENLETNSQIAAALGLGSPDRELSDLGNPESWPDEPDRDRSDANDPENWRDASDPSDAEKGASDRAAAVLEAAVARLRATPPKPNPWDEYETSGALVIQEQRMTAVYENNSGGVVIRQADPDGCDDEDPFIWFGKHYAEHVIRAIAEVAGLETSEGHAQQNHRRKSG
jgi:hypothetical protein